MVVWLFAGGGYTELKGLVPFLKKHFSGGCKFERKTPVKHKPGPKPNKVKSGYGKTGKSLEAEIKKRIRIALATGEKCDKILVIDDLDCRDYVKQENKFISAVNAVKDAESIDKFVGFAAPEMEAWIIADWDNSIAKHSDFRNRQKSMRHWISQRITFKAPETFGVYNKKKDTCNEKLSDAIIEASVLEQGERYSKRIHTPLLLMRINPKKVAEKCPLFRKLFNWLNKLCNETSITEIR